jgi:hypothetical protein
MMGVLVREVLAYDGGRSVTVYVPPSRPETIVFAGDESECRCQPS